MICAPVLDAVPQYTHTYSLTMSAHRVPNTTGSGCSAHEIERKMQFEDEAKIKTIKAEKWKWMAQM